MKINPTKGIPLPKGKLLKIIMRTFLFLCLTSVFSFAPNNTFSQNAKIEIDADKTISVAEIFDLIQEQAGYKFVYSDNLINNAPKVRLKKGTILAKELIKEGLSPIGCTFEFTENETVIVKKDRSFSIEKSTDDQKIQFAITGNVQDENGEPLPGANILEKGTTNGTQTDFDGNFSLEVADENAILVISYIGFATQEIAVNGQTDLSITLAEDAAGLDEVVVVGYGSQKKVNLTGAVVSVKGDDINKRPITQGSQALQGVASGVFVNTNSGEPGNDDASIIIRGVGTLNDAEPLVLIDGIEAPINSINSNDIESVNVLKDAASASIYGTRAANGVVLITTKRGKEGKTTVTYNSAYSITSPTVLPKMVTDTRLYLETFVKAAAYSGRNHPYTPALIDEIAALGSTDWVGDYINTGAIQDHDVSISGGTNKLKARFSTRYQDQDGYIKGDWFTKRLNTRLNVDMSLSDKIKIGTSLSYVNRNNRQAPKNDPSSGLRDDIGIVDRYQGKGNFLYQILLASAPNAFVKDEFGRYGGTGGESSRSQRDNPQGLIDNQWIDIDGNEFLGNAFVEYEPLEGLKIRYTSGINFQQESYEAVRLEYEQYDRFGNRTAVRVPGSLLRTQESTILDATNWLQATYQKEIGNHNFSLLAGVNQETSTIRRIATYEKGFGSTALVRVGNGTESVDIGNYNGEWALQSIFGRLNYNYKDKYLLEANVRRDGSSRFGSNNRWATFPGISAGYVLSNEDFWNVNFISHLKLRGSWGKLGVQSSNLYPFASEFNLGNNYNGNSGAVLSKLGNPNLAWEETTTKDFGIDVKLFGGKVSLEADYFEKNSSNILTDLDNPLTTGVASKISVNSAEIENKGWDLSLNTRNSIGKLKISTSLNLTHVKNKVVQINPALTNQGDKVQVAAAKNVWWIRGEPVNAIFGHKFGGIFQVEDFNTDGSLVDGTDYTWIGATPRPGDIKYTDQNGDNVINEEDMVVIGNRNPEWLYGFNLDLKYKQWDFNMFFQGVGKVNSMVPRYTGNFGHSGLREFWLNGWTEENRSNTVPRISVDGDGFTGRTIFGNGRLAQNSFWVIDQSYTRLKNIVLGYSLPSETLERLPISKLRLYVSGQNLLTFSNLDDLDPERNQFANHFGGTLPQQKAVTLGLNLTF